MRFLLEQNCQLQLLLQNLELCNVRQKVQSVSAKFSDPFV